METLERQDCGKLLEGGVGLGVCWTVGVDLKFQYGGLSSQEVLDDVLAKVRDHLHSAVVISARNVSVCGGMDYTLGVGVPQDRRVRFPQCSVEGETSLVLL